jgi:hypothetical protein
MSPITYEVIADNVAEAKVNGGQVLVTWRCPATGRVVGTSTAGMSADNSLGHRVGASLKRSIASELIYGLARTISALLGGAAGRVISNATYTAAGDINARVTANADYSEDSRRAAVVAAFESVKGSFDWDEKRRQFVAKQAGSSP